MRIEFRPVSDESLRDAIIAKEERHSESDVCPEVSRLNEKAVFHLVLKLLALAVSGLDGQPALSCNDDAASLAAALRVIPPHSITLNLLAGSITLHPTTLSLYL